MRAYNVEVHFEWHENGADHYRTEHHDFCGIDPERMLNETLRECRKRDNVTFAEVRGWVDGRKRRWIIERDESGEWYSYER